MVRYSNTTTGTYGTTEAAATALKVPGPCKLVGVWAMSVTGTGVVYQLRFDFPGMKTPQTYLLPVLNALEGTEVGSGQKVGAYVPLDLDVPSNVSEITIYGTASADSQSAVIGVIWEA